MTESRIARIELLELVGLQSAQLDNFARRGALPFDRSERSWTSYTLDHALRLQLFRALSDSGIDQVSAATAVRAGYEDLIEAAEATSASDGPMLFGMYINRAESPDEIVYGRHELSVRAGALGEHLLSLVERDRQQGDSFVRVIFVSASDAVDRLLARLPPKLARSSKARRLRQAFLGGENG